MKTTCVFGIGDVGIRQVLDATNGTETLHGRDLPSVHLQIENRQTLSYPSISSPFQHVQHEGVSIDEVLKIFTFLAAGHETTYSVLTWGFFALAKDHRVQSKPREASRRSDEVEVVGSEGRKIMTMKLKFIKKTNEMKLPRLGRPRMFTTTYARITKSVTVHA